MIMEMVTYCQHGDTDGYLLLAPIMMTMMEFRSCYLLLAPVIITMMEMVTYCQLQPWWQ